MDGADLWEDPWLDRWRALFRTPEWRAAVYHVAYYQFLRPMLRHARLWTAAELAVLFDMANANGVTGARRRLPDDWQSVHELICGSFKTARSRQRRFDVANASPFYITFEPPGQS